MKSFKSNFLAFDSASFLNTFLQRYICCLFISHWWQSVGCWERKGISGLTQLLILLVTIVTCQAKVSKLLGYFIAYYSMALIGNSHHLFLEYLYRHICTNKFLVYMINYTVFFYSNLLHIFLFPSYINFFMVSLAYLAVIDYLSIQYYGVLCGARISM